MLFVVVTPLLKLAVRLPLSSWVRPLNGADAGFPTAYRLSSSYVSTGSKPKPDQLRVPQSDGVLVAETEY